MAAQKSSKKLEMLSLLKWCNKDLKYILHPCLPKLKFKSYTKNSLHKVVHTLPKFNMEPENKPLE